MRILFVMTGADTGGAERLVALLGRNWPAGDQLRLVVLLGPGSLSPELEAAFGDVRYLDIPPGSRRLDLMVRRLEDEIRTFRPDVVASHMFHADLVAALARTSATRISTQHTQALGSGDLLLTKLIARAVGLLSFRFDAVVPTSDSEDMRAFGRRLGFRNVTEAIPNATEIPASASFDPGARSIVSIARNHPVKGQPLLIEAFARVASRHPDWSLRLVGPGVTPTDAPFATLLADGEPARLAAEGRLALCGPTSDPGAVLDAAGVLVISSLYGETTPLVGLEAGARGVPVVATRVGSCPQFVDDPRFVVAPGSVDELAEALDTWMDLDDEERRRLSALARARAERTYDAGRAARRYRDLFARVHAGRRG